MEKRFNGYVPRRMKTARAKRMLTAHAQLAAARKRVSCILSLVLLLLMGLSVLFLVKGSFKENLTLLLVLLSVFVGFTVLTVVYFVVGRALYGGKPDSQKIGKLLHRYICGLLGDTYRMYEREIIGRDRDQLIRRYALEYIYDFRMLAGERERLLADGGLEIEAEAIRRRYEDFLTYVISGDQAAQRYITLRRNMAKVLEKWRHHNLSRYDKPQRAVIEDNIKRVTRTVTEQYERFLSHLGVREYMMLMNDVIYYDITADKSLWKPLPIKKKYRAYCNIVKKIEEAKPSKMIGAGRSSALFDHAFALESYRQFTKTYATVACPILKGDISVYEEELAAAQKAQDTCWRCGEKYHPRFREVRDKCGHYICPRCNVCYCMSQQSRRRRERGAPTIYDPDAWWRF